MPLAVHAGERRTGSQGNRALAEEGGSDMAERWRLDGAKTLVTGGSRGIGVGYGSHRIRCTEGRGCPSPEGASLTERGEPQSALDSIVSLPLPFASITTSSRLNGMTRSRSDR